MIELSIIVPLYNEEESLPELQRQIDAVCRENKYTYEIIYVDDGSYDKSLAVLQELRAQQGDIVKIVSFRRNYGKSAALHEGFKRASGKYVVTMDADLQDDPAEIPNLIAAIEEGYDLVSGWKKKRHDPLNKTIPSKFFNWFTSLVSGIRLHDFNCGLKIYRHEVVKSLRVYGEMHRYLPVLAHWNGFRVSELVVNHRARKFGRTKFGVARFFNGFFDLLTVIFITKFNRAPLHFFGFTGAALFFVGFVVELYLTVEWILGVGIGQRPLFFFGILMIIVGAQFVLFGLLGEMLTHHFDTQAEYTIKREDGFSN
jgi:glycosyltransferase involved in cell wall biosynthesis